MILELHGCPVRNISTILSYAISFNDTVMLFSERLGTSPSFEGPWEDLGPALPEGSMVQLEGTDSMNIWVCEEYLYIDQKVAGYPAPMMVPGAAPRIRKGFSLHRFERHDRSRC